MTADNVQLDDSGHGHSSVRFEQQFSQLESKWAMMCKWLRLRHCAPTVAATMRSLEFLQTAAALFFFFLGGKLYIAANCPQR